ncbi:MAG: ribonuclease H [Acidobacteriota bacterium]
MKPEILARYPGWQPKQCLKCKNSSGRTGAAESRSRASRSSAPRAAGSRAKGGRSRGSKRKGGELNLTTAEVLERFNEGPTDGVFTDGACTGNPGPGGWGAVWVRDNAVVEQRHGHEARTTNNRMELTALIAAYEMLPTDAEVTIWSDSNLCVRTINEWAAGWKARGWKRKTGPVENLDLVQLAYDASLRHRHATLRWIKAHAGSRWNEYADALATAYTRDTI